MTWSISDLFPDWGEAGQSPGDGFFYEGGDQVNEKHMDYLWDNLDGLQDEVRSALTDIDSDKDGVVDKADEADGGPSSVSDSGTSVINYPTDIDFDTQLNVTDDGDGTVTVDVTLSPPFSIPDNTLALDFDDDSGAEVVADMGVTSNPTAGTEESLSLAIDNNEVIKAYAEADGSGGIQNKRVDVLSANLRLYEGYPIEDETGNRRIQFQSARTRIRGVNDSFTPRIDVEDGSGVVLEGDGNPISVVNSDISMSADTSIVEGGTDRILFSSTSTTIYDEDGNNAARFSNGSHRLYAYSGIPVDIYDSQGSFVGMEYLSDPSNGTVRLTNSNLDINKQSIRNPGGFSQINGQEKTIGGTLTTIADITQGAFILVAGNEDGNSAITFIDVVVAARDGTFTVMNSASRNGPSSRTYNVNDTALEVKMDSGTNYKVRSLNMR